MNKITDFNIGQDVDFFFLDTPNKGTVAAIDKKDSSLSVKTKTGTVHKVYLTEKDSKFCYLKKM